MRRNAAPEFDLPALAGDVVAGTRSLANVIDQIAVATTDDRKRRRRIAELQTLIVAIAEARSLPSTVDGGRSAAEKDAPRPNLVERLHAAAGCAVAAGLATAGALVIGAALLFP